MYLLLLMLLFADQVSIRFVLQSVKGISIVLQKLLKFFNDTAISTSFAFQGLFQQPAAGALSVIIASKLNDSEFVLLLFVYYLFH